MNSKIIYENSVKNNTKMKDRIKVSENTKVLPMETKTNSYKYEKNRKA
jgi:hypothetical protein